MPLEATGYACTTEQLLDVLLAVSAEKETIEQVCSDLQLKVGAETIRGTTGGVCTDVCERCAEHCESMADGDDFMQRCADACRKCAESCREMSSSASSASM